MIVSTDKNEFNLAKDALKAFLWNHGQYVINTILLGLTTYILARFLEPAGYGIFSATMAFGSVIAMFVSFGFEGALNVHLPRLRGNFPELRYLFKQMLIRRLFIIAAFFLIILLLNSFLKDLWIPASIKKLDNYLHLAVICGFISLVSGLVTRVLITLFRVKYFAVIRIIYLTLTLTIYFYLLVNNYGIKEILWAAIIISFSAVILYLFACRDLLTGKTKKYDLSKFHKFGLTIWTNDLLGYLLGKDLDIIIMTFYEISTAHIGFYHIAFTLIAYARMIITKGMTGVLQSAFSSAYNKGGIESLGKWWMITMKFQILVVSPGVLFLVLFARQIFESILPKYSDATLLVHTYGSLAFIITVLGGGTHITAFYAIGKEKIVFYTRLLAGILNLILDIILIYFFGVLGAIIATGISGVVVGCLELGLIFSSLRIKYPYIFLLKCFICLAFAGFFASQVTGTGLLGLIFCGCFYFVTYLFAAWVIKPFDKKDIVHFHTANKHLSNFLTPFCAKANFL